MHIVICILLGSVILRLRVGCARFRFVPAHDLLYVPCFMKLITAVIIALIFGIANFAYFCMAFARALSLPPSGRVSRARLL